MARQLSSIIYKALTTTVEALSISMPYSGDSVVERMGREQLVKGMNVTTYEKGQGSCEDCIMGKHTRRPFDDNTTRETEVLERVYIDLWGLSGDTRLHLRLHLRTPTFTTFDILLLSIPYPTSLPIVDTIHNPPYHNSDVSSNLRPFPTWSFGLSRAIPLFPHMVPLLLFNIVPPFI